MAKGKPTFFERATRGSRLARAVWRVIIIVALFNVALGIWSAYSAWVQVRKLELVVAGPSLRPGMPAIVHVVSSGRTFVTVRLERARLLELDDRGAASDVPAGRR